MNVQCNRVVNCPVIVVGLFIACAASAEVADSEAEVTRSEAEITHSEAPGSLAIDPEGFEPIPMERTFLSVDQPGPQIVLRKPIDNSVLPADEPVAVHVEFLPAADGSEPDMSTLNVRVRKGWFGMDITDDLAPYVTGDEILVPELDFAGHTGKFRFRIRISDYRERESEVVLRVKIEA